MRAYEKDPELRAEFARLQRGFLDSALAGVDEVLTIIDEAGDATPAGEAGKRLRTIAHGLRGAGGSYGFDAVTSSAGELEEAFLAGKPAKALRDAAIELGAAVRAARRVVDANTVAEARTAGD
jgi:HPt (histidine-containing phosphotransfer) domain-containing protein